MIAAYACWRQGFTVGTIYATLGEEGALFGINQSKCKAVVRQHAHGGLASWGRHSSPPWPPGADSAGSWLRYALGTSRVARSRPYGRLRCGRAVAPNGADCAAILTRTPTPTLTLTLTLTIARAGGRLQAPEDPRQDRGQADGPQGRDHHHRTVRPQAKPQPAVPARGCSRLRREVVPLLCSPG